jgi:hypothetical protein
MLLIFFPTLKEFRGISQTLRASLYNMYEFEYFKGTVSQYFLFYFLLLNTKLVLYIQMLTVFKFFS